LLKAIMLPITTDDPVAWSICMSVCMSVTLVHPATAVGQNDMPFGRDTGVVPSNSVLDRDTSPPTGRGDLGDWNPQFAAMLGTIH